MRAPAAGVRPALHGAELGGLAGRLILVGLSGGPDSTALLLWLLAEGSRVGIEVAAAHFDHALRPGSERDAAHVAALCERHRVPLISERREGPLARGSLQAAARAARLGFLERARKAAGADLVALGHTADDVVEGVLLHLLRGTGLAGLRGMPAARAGIVRPLLGVWRADVEAYLAERGEVPLRDPSNAAAETFERARVRHRLLPRLAADRPGLAGRLRRVAARAAALQEGLEGAAAATGPGREALARSPQPLRMEVYRQLYGRAGSLPALCRRQLEAMDRLALRGRSGQGLDLPGGLRFRVEPGRVSIDVRVVPRPPLPRLVLTGCPATAGRPCPEPEAPHLRAAAALSVGYRVPGLRMRTAPGAGTRKLQDILTDAKFPAHRRDSLPLVFAQGRLAWVPGVALDPGARPAAGEPAVHVSLAPARPAAIGLKGPWKG